MAAHGRKIGELMTSQHAKSIYQALFLPIQYIEFLLLTLIFVVGVQSKNLSDLYHITEFLVFIILLAMPRRTLQCLRLMIAMSVTYITVKYAVQVFVGDTKINPYLNIFGLQPVE